MDSTAYDDSEDKYNRAISHLWFSDNYSCYLDIYTACILSRREYVKVDDSDTRKSHSDQFRQVRCTLTKKGKLYGLTLLESPSKMIYETTGKVLKTNLGELIKRIDCPIDPACIELKPVPKSLIKLYCDKCDKNVINIDQMTCDQVKAIVQYDPDVCFCFTKYARHIDFIEEHKDCRIIYTARTIEMMNAAVDMGFFPLLKSVENRADIGKSIIVNQDDDTGKIAIKNIYYREPFFEEDEGNRYWYKNGYHEYPFAAYLIPDDLVQGEEVWLDDLIEDFRIHWANYNDTSTRKPCAKAVWNGTDFIIDSKRNEGPFIVG